MGVFGLHATSRGASEGECQNRKNPTLSLVVPRHAAWSAARLEASLILASLPCYCCSRCTNFDLSVRQKTHREQLSECMQK